MRIVMIGSGYVGLVSGACLADFGHEVICVDKSTEKVEALEPAIGALCAGHWSNLHARREPPQPRAVHPAYASLTLREREIITMVLRGHSNFRHTGQAL